LQLSDVGLPRGANVEELIITQSPKLFLKAPAKSQQLQWKDDVMPEGTSKIDPGETLHRATQADFDPRCAMQSNQAGPFRPQAVYTGKPVHN